jgi:Flp pilus assembly protein TadG
MRRFRLNPPVRFARDERGAVLVEFALTFPLMLLFLAVVVEISRMLWAYQIAISGVRDASRYLSRRVPLDICVGSAATDAPLSAYDSTVTAIVGSALGGGSAFPVAVTVTDVAPTYSCRAGSYRVNPAPVTRVTANLTMAVPLASLFGYFVTVPATISTSVSSEARVFGI